MTESFDDAGRGRRDALRPDEKAVNWPVRPGMEVVGADGKSAGHVKEVRRTDFLVARPLARDVYVPYDACKALEGERVTLTVAAGEVNDQGWANPGVEPGEHPFPPSERA